MSKYYLTNIKKFIVEYEHSVDPGHTINCVLDISVELDKCIEFSLKQIPEDPINESPTNK